jgi:hypothetical protein
MPGMDTNLLVKVSRALPAPVSADGAVVGNPRASRYLEQLVQPVVLTKHVLADEGAYFLATNPTPGTAIAYGSAGTQAAFSDTVPFFLIKNNAALGGKRTYLDYLKLLESGTAPATTTSVQVAIKVDSANRFPTSAASTFQAITPVNVNADDSTQPSTQLWVPNGAVATIPASSGSARLVARSQLKGGPTLSLDEYKLAFGVVDIASDGGYLTTVASYASRSAPIVIGPQEYAIIHLWFPGGATNPFSFEFELGLWER